MSRAGGGIIKNAAIVGIMTGLSRILGLAREILTALFFGTSVLQSAFVFAFQIPNLFRKLFGEGALSSAFIPVFAKSLTTDTQEESRLFARRILTLLGLFLGAIALVGIVVLYIVEPFLPANFKYLAAMPLLRIMLPYAPLICMTAIAMGILNTLGEFKAPAATTCLLNIVWIAVLLGIIPFVSGGDEVKIRIVSYAILLAGFLQLLYLLLVLKRKGWRITPAFSFASDKRLKRVIIETLPLAFSSAVTQVNLLIDNLFALSAATWAASSISYAERIVYLPLGVIATAYSTVLLPEFSRLFAKGDEKGAKQTLDSALSSILVPIIPAAVGIAILSSPITKAIYERGAFNQTSTTHVSLALTCYAIGLPFFGIQKSLTQFFFGRRDKATPIRISILTVLLNFALNLLFFFLLPSHLRHAGIAIATSFSSLISCLLLAISIERKTPIHLNYCLLLKTALTTTISATIMAFFAHFLWKYLIPHQSSSLFFYLTLATTITLSFLIYSLVLAILNPVAVKGLFRKLRRK